MKLTKVCDAPKYIKENPYLDLSKVLDSGRAQEPLENVHVLNEWPDINSTTLDESQVSALRSILTKELAVVQGPPGTGKTYVSVLALKAILGNMSNGDPPVIVTAQTNHALDQLLRHIAVFEPDFIRLGGRTTDQDVIKNRTLHEVRKTIPTPKISGGLRGPAMRRLKDLTESMITILTPLQQKEPLSPELLRNLNILSDAQYESFRKGAEDWVRIVDGNRPPGPMALWLGDSLSPVNNYHEPEDFGFEVEDVDLEFEQLREMEAEASGHAADEDENDTLKGTWFPLKVHYQGEQSTIAGTAIQRALGMDDMWEIPDHMRGTIYNCLWRKAVSILEISFRAKAEEYMDAVRQLKLGKWELDFMILQKAKVVGMTITGLSKYRGLVASLKPRIIMVEEAAETLEGLVMSACMESVEHLVLVG
jgi:helicase required for RNAi-mediated heterochromatin assembly 1